MEDFFTFTIMTRSLYDGNYCYEHIKVKALESAFSITNCNSQSTRFYEKIVLDCSKS